MGTHGQTLVGFLLEHMQLENLFAPVIAPPAPQRPCNYKSPGEQSVYLLVSSSALSGVLELRVSNSVPQKKRKPRQTQRSRESSESET